MSVKTMIRVLGTRILPASLCDFARWIVHKRLRGIFTLRGYLLVRRLSRARGVLTKSVESIQIHLPLLDRLDVSLRPGTSDASVLIETLVWEYHLPPRSLQPKVIWDLGANIGLTAAHFAVLYPDAMVYAVEPSPELVRIAKRHTAFWRDRINVISAAVWPVDEEIHFAFSFGNEFGGAANVDGCGFTVQGRSLNSLLSSVTVVDFLKMDIEGAEKRVLREHTEWAYRVRCIKVECHSDYSREDCINDLRGLGFQAEIDPCHWSCVLGNRGL